MIDEYPDVLQKSCRRQRHLRGGETTARLFQQGSLEYQERRGLQVTQLQRHQQMWGCEVAVHFAAQWVLDVRWKFGQQSNLDEEFPLK
jgi:hypothetical protein